MDSPTVMVLGPHSSGTGIHAELVRELLRENPDNPYQVEHMSLPYGPLDTSCARYIWVQRDPHVTALSQEVHGYGKRLDTYEGAWAQVWDAHIQWADLARTLDPNHVLSVWYKETVDHPRRFAEQCHRFLNTKFTPPGFGHQLYDGSAKYA